jgi:hypothetical protein
MAGTDNQGLRMSELVTLELPEDVVRRAREVAHRTGRRPEGVLAEWVERGAGADTAIEVELRTGDAYPIYTPYGNEAAAQALLDVLAANAKTDERR